MANQGKYTLPDSALTLRQVSIKDESGFWHDLDPITLEDIHTVSTEDEFQDTASTPRFYRLISNVIEIYPAPDYSQTRSIRAQFDRGSTSFASTDTTKTPGFAAEFHDALHIGAAVTIGANRTIKNYNAKVDQYRQKLDDIEAYYKARFVELNATSTRTHLEDPLSVLN